MNPRIVLCVALVLSSGLFGCCTRQIPSAPNAEQMRAWAGFPEDFRLRAVTESVTNQDKESKSMFGNLIWACSYENPERSLVSLSVSISQPGTLWSTNHTRYPKHIEEELARLRSLKKSISPGERELLEKDFQIIALPHGRKAYFTILGFGPGGEGLVGFAYERDYDLMVMEDFSTENGVAEKQAAPPVKPANDLPIIFRKVEEFLAAQKNTNAKP